MNGNRVLRDILYHQVCETVRSCDSSSVCDLCVSQIREMFLCDSYVGLTGVDKDKTLAQV